MQPKIDIRKRSERYFTYSIGLGEGEELYARDGLLSMAECLHDAATALGHNFPVTTISYEGTALGDHSVHAMEHDTVLLASRLQSQLAAGRTRLNEVDEPYPRHWLRS